MRMPVRYFDQAGGRLLDQRPIATADDVLDDTETDRRIVGAAGGRGRPCRGERNSWWQHRRHGGEDSINLLVAASAGGQICNPTAFVGRATDSGWRIGGDGFCHEWRFRSGAPLTCARP